MKIHEFFPLTTPTHIWYSFVVFYTKHYRIYPMEEKTKSTAYTYLTFDDWYQSPNEGGFSLVAEYLTAPRDELEAAFNAGRAAENIQYTGDYPITDGLRHCPICGRWARRMAVNEHSGKWRLTIDCCNDGCPFEAIYVDDLQYVDLREDLDWSEIEKHWNTRH